MSEFAVQVEELGKKYRIGAQQERYRTLRDQLVKSASKSISRLRGENRPSNAAEFIWALRNVNLKVRHGEVVGVIGRNGAGKSTLLKILAHITEPTEGRVRLRGRVGSLLEVGTGFHPELTGRENVYLNGAILGMRRVEIERKFDEIVSFAEIEKFVDTPVKRYSSGMYVRLAFAVAAHLEPEILLVDEVLAVGDAAFQQKCLEKMESVARDGRTVLFVSHNLSSISRLCSRCFVLDLGRTRFEGAPGEAIDYYLASFKSSGVADEGGIFDLTNRQNIYPPHLLLVKNLQLQNSRREPRNTFQMGSELRVSLEVEGLSDYQDAMLGVTIKSREDQWLGSINTGMVLPQVRGSRQKREIITLTIPQIPFTPGSYWLSVSVARGGVGRIDYIDRAASFYVTEADVYQTGYHISADYGMIYLNGSWEIEPCQVRPADGHA